MNRRRNNSIAANPILIGGVTVLVTIVAVFLSYNANHGLPFVPTYKVDVELPDAAGLIAGNEVRISGGHASASSRKISRDHQGRRLDRRAAWSSRSTTPPTAAASTAWSRFGRSRRWG